MSQRPQIPWEWETYLQYHGNSEEVNQQIHFCQQCGARLLLSHLSDHQHLYVQETTRCLDCSQGTKRVFHQLN